MALMDWIAGNYERAAAARARGRLSAEAEQIQQYAPQVQAIMGTPAAGPPDLYGNQPQAATGLMAADPGDPMAYIQAGMGLMQLPGYQSMANAFIGTAVGNALGRPGEAARLAETRRYHDAQLEMQRLQAEQARARMVGFGGPAYQDMNQYVSASDTLRDNARAELEPFRQQMGLYNTVQGLVGNKGFHKMSTVDDEMLIKSYAKMLLPNEAVMTDDINRIATSEKMSAILRAQASKVGAKMSLDPDERMQLWESMRELAASALPRYEQTRIDHTQRALRQYINPADVLNTVITMDSRRFGLDYKRPGELTEGIPGQPTDRNNPGTLENPEVEAW